ncbi:MAG: lactate utilization protein [Deltaproteobacteria bacterium]|nr:lactate utilization protein [Deltaproteobacteria bacterium]
MTETHPSVRVASHRALAAREQIVGTYPQWEAWREQARAIKAEVIDHLDDFLEQLQRQVRSWGGEVLWAEDATQARRLILEVARRHQVQAVVKAKSMATEEINLNPALEAAGITVSETDLGEFIVQLAGNRPSHITAPALHLNREQIADLFSDRLGVRPQTDPSCLSRQGARFLRPSFWEAQMGITGVNFAAAASGTLVMLENEGNLRLSATVPPVHLALMGIEKIIPRLTDLEVFLRLLPASATGQRLTAYVNFIGGLKKQPQGNQAFYLVLLDNGRRRLAAHPEWQEALYCLRCGACLNICPIFQLGGGHLYGQVYPGAIGILLAPFLSHGTDLTDLCTQCGACSLICPVKINLADKIARRRAQSTRHRGLRLLMQGAAAIMARPRLYRGLEPWLRLVRQHLPATGQKYLWGPGRCLPELAPQSYHRMMQSKQKSVS